MSDAVGGTVSYCCSCPDGILFPHIDFNRCMTYYMYVMYVLYKRRDGMYKTITTADARKNFADIVNQVAYGTEPVILTRRGQEIAALISIEELRLLQKIEDHIDIEDANKALDEQGDNITAEEFWKQLGL